MRKVLLACLLMTSTAAQAMCYSVFDASDKLIFRSTKSPVSLSGSTSAAVQQRFPGGHMTMFDEPCEFLDLTTKEGINRTKELQERRRGEFALQYTPKPGEPGNSNPVSIPVSTAIDRPKTRDERATCHGDGAYRVCVDSTTNSSGDTKIESWDNHGNSYSVESWSSSRGVHAEDSRGNRCTITNAGSVIGCGQ